MAELVDALDSKPGSYGVRVQVPSELRFDKNKILKILLNKFDKSLIIC